MPDDRLRWRVLKQFGILPGEERAKNLYQRDILYCVLQQWLDEEEKLEMLCPTCRDRAMETRCTVGGAPLQEGEEIENTAFDMERYRRLKEGETD